MNETVYMIVSLSNQKCRFSKPEQLQDPYIVRLRSSNTQDPVIEIVRPIKWSLDHVKFER